MPITSDAPWWSSPASAAKASICPRYQGDTEGAYSPDSHYLELDANERDMLTAVCEAGFDHVIVMFNVPASFEATFLHRPRICGCGRQD